MGTSLELRVRAENRKAAEAAEDRVLREIDRLAAIFSGYDPASELSRWQERRPASQRRFRRALRSPASVRPLDANEPEERSTRGPRR